MRILRAAMAAVAVLVAACLAAGATASTRVVVVVNHGWHTGIAIERADVSPAAIPETADFPDAAHFEFGWGDAEYYPAPNPSFAMALRAATPGPAVLHLVGLPVAPTAAFPAAETIIVSLPEPGLHRLVAFIAASIDRGGSARAAPVAPGLFADSRFYPATGRFHLFNTCNTWTARALAAAGLPIAAEGVQTAADLVARLRAALARRE